MCTQKQFFLDTAEVESNQFFLTTDQEDTCYFPRRNHRFGADSSLMTSFPSGTYRVISGELYRIVDYNEKLL